MWLVLVLFVSLQGILGRGPKHFFYLLVFFFFFLVDSLKCVRLLEPGYFKGDYPITTFFENKRLSRCFAKGPITFINLRAVSQEVKYVQTVLKFSSDAYLNLEFY